MTEIQKIQYDMLLKLDEVCHRHGLRYYLAFGTCRGAMRHNGFIPWDHDVDVLMPADDAWKLSEYQKEFGDRYFVSNRRNDKGYKHTIMRIVDYDHKCQIKKNGKIIEKDFVCMDIYPFYNCPMSKMGLLMNIWRSHIQKILVGGTPKNHGILFKIIGSVILSLVKENKRNKYIERIECKLNYKGKSKEIADYFGQDVSFCNAIKYRKEWFEKPKPLMFEGRYFDGPTYPEAYLATRYGDFMKPPSEAQISNEIKCELID